jgi:hypothetical protein
VAKRQSRGRAVSPAAAVAIIAKDKQIERLGDIPLPSRQPVITPHAYDIHIQVPSNVYSHFLPPHLLVSFLVLCKNPGIKQVRAGLDSWLDTQGSVPIFRISANDDWSS